MGLGLTVNPPTATPTFQGFVDAAVNAAIARLLGGAGPASDTLKELADAIAGITLTGLGGITPAGVDSKITALVASSPAALDTLKELADALGNDPAFATTVSTALANRLQLWLPNTPQPANAIRVAPDGSIVQAKAAFTTGAAFDVTNWTVLVPTAASVAAAYLALPGGTKATGKAPVVQADGSIQWAATSNGLSVVDAGNGSLTITSTGSATVTDNGNGSLTIAA